MSDRDLYSDPRVLDALARHAHDLDDLAQERLVDDALDYARANLIDAENLAELLIDVPVDDTTRGLMARTIHALASLGAVTLREGLAEALVPEAIRQIRERERADAAAERFGGE